MQFRKTQYKNFKKNSKDNKVDMNKCLNEDHENTHTHKNEWNKNSSIRENRSRITKENPT